MGFQAGEIVIELTAKDGGFTASVKNAGQLMKALKVDMEATAKSVRRLEEAQFSLGTKFRNLIIMMGNFRFALMDLNDAFVRLPASILKSASDLEKTQALLTGLSKASTKAAREVEGAANFSYITDMAQKAPFAIGNLANAFVKFKSAGLDPTNGSMRALVDSVAKFGGTGQTLERASIAIQQMAGKGVISMEELRQQLGEAVPTAMQSMAIGMGMSMAKLTDLVSKGVVEAKQALLRMFVVMNEENRGAALELMKTWEGTLSQLKTEWQLTAKSIYDSGFGDAVKEAANSITAALRTNEFKRFAVESGEFLGSVVRGILETGKKLVEFADTLKTIAGAWLAYKVTTGLLVPTFEALGLAFQKMSKKFADAQQVSEISRNNIQQTFAKTAAAAMKEADAAVAASRYKVQQIEAELVAHRKYAAELQAQRAAAMQAQNESFSRRNGIVDPTGNRVSPTTRLNDIAAESRANSAAMARLQEELRVSQAELARTATGAATVAAKIVAIENGAQATSRAMVMMQTAANAAGAAFQFLGGWTTVLNLAIAAGIYLMTTWESAADKAAKAAQRARNAARGLSNEEEVKASNEAAQKALQERDRLFDQLNSFKDRNKSRKESPIAKVREQYEAELKTLEDSFKNANSKYEELKRVSLQAQQAVDERIAREQADGDLRVTRERIDSINARVRDEQIALNDANQKLLEAAGSDTKKIDAIQKKYGEDFKRSAQSGARERIAAILAALKEVETSTPRGKSLNTELRKMLLDAQNDLRNIEESMKDFKFSKPKVEKQQANPLGDLITKLQGDRAELEAELRGFDQLTGKFDVIKGAQEKIKALYDLGKFDVRQEDGTKVRPSKEKLKEAIDLEGQTEGLKVFKADLDKVSDLMRDVAPRYQEALAILNDPLGVTKNGRRENQAAKVLRDIKPENLEKIAKMYGKTVDELQAIVGQSMVSDMSADWQKLAQEALEAERNVTELTADQQRQRRLDDIETFRVREQNRIDDLVKIQGYSDAVKLLQSGLDRWVSAKTAEANKKNKTPMQEMLERWKDTTKQMEEATARWGQSTIDTFVEAAKTGKFAFGELVKSILADMLKIQLQKQLSSGIELGGNFLMSTAKSLFGFANGGIMTGMGAVPLRQYAAGGIAKSPQMAIFGEGSMAEAYVPLPDGRSIPVTMDGNASPNVTVNVINQSGTEVSAKTGAPRFDGRQMVLDVVLTAAAQPGAFRDNLRAAMENK